MKMIKCKQCGFEFSKHKNKTFCCGKCRAGYNRKKHVPKPPKLTLCIICGTPFRKKFQKHVTCKSRECHKALLAMRQSGEIIDPEREPYIQEMIKKYDNIFKALNDNNIPLNSSSLYVDKRLSELEAKGLYVPYTPKTHHNAIQSTNSARG